MSKQPENIQDSPEQKKSKAEKNIYLRKLGTLALSLGLSIALSIGATIEANNKNAKKNINQVSYDENEIYGDKSSRYDTSLGLHDTIPGDLDISLPGVEISKIDHQAKDLGTADFIETTTSHTTESKITDENVQLMEWAALFDKDPMAVEPRGIDVISDVADQTEQLVKDGWAIEKVAIKGFASDEAISDNPKDDGFGIRNEPNIRLANKRADAVKTLYEKKLEDALLPTISNDIKDKIVVEEGEEVINIKEASDIQAAADSLGISTIDLIDQYNHNPSSLPVEAQDAMSELKDDRYVSIKITASRDIVTQNETTTTMNIKQEIETKKSVVIIPIFIPILSRKKRYGSEPGSGYTPEPIPTYEPKRLPKFDAPEPIIIRTPPYSQEIIDSQQIAQKQEKVVEKFSPVKNIGQEKDPYKDNFYRRKQPRPYNNAQSNQHVIGQKGNRMTRDRGGNAQ